MRVACVALAAALTAQNSQPPTFRARTDLVRLDVVVVDADGHAVHGLTRHDFEVLDRGRPQSVAAFDEITHARSASALPLSLKRDVADNSASQSDRLIILVLDDLHFQAKTSEVKEMARRVVTGIGPRAALALLTTSGAFGVEPTEDRAVLLAEIDRFLDKFDPEGRRLAPGAEVPVPGPLSNAIGEVVPVRGPRDPATLFAGVSGFKAVTDAAKKIGSFPGRRNAFVWISGGIRSPSAGHCGLKLNDHPTATIWYCNALAGLLESLRKANAAAYSIFTRDFTAGLLRDVADASGGFVMDALNFERDLPRLIDDLDHYYLIGFYPEDISDRKFHPVEVRVKRAGPLTVRYRHGYQPGAPPKPKNASALARLSEGVLSVADLPLRMTATNRAPSPGLKSGTVITLEVRTDRRRLVEADGHLRDVLKYQVWAVDVRKKKPVKTVAREARFDLAPAESAATADLVAYQVNTMLALSPGRYQLRASAASAKAGTGGSVYYEIEIPDFKKTPKLSDIVVGYAIGPRVPIVRGGLGTERLPVHPTLDREFSRADSIRLVCDLARQAGGSVNAVIDLLASSGEPVRRLASRRFDRAESSTIDVTLPLNDLAPGGYLVRITATEGASATHREAGFVVK